MTSYQELVIPDHMGMQQITPQKNPDLPNTIMGAAIWITPSTNAKGNTPPPSYHILHNDTYHPVEFVNNTWHFIDWDDGKYLGYWITPKHRIEPGTYQLGWLGNITEGTTPRGPGTSFVQIRERAESASTQPKEVSPIAKEEEDNLVDRDPIQTEALVESLFFQSTFADIAEEVEPSQPREHYLLTTLPSAHGLTPIGVNPIQARSTVTASAPEAISATQGAAQLITNAVKIDGQLKGKVPDTFDGDRTKTENFMNSFDLFWMTNDENSAMKIPYKQCTYFLGLLSRAKVDDWVYDQTKVLLKKVTCRSDPIKKTDENLWEDLKDAFTRAFANTSKIEDAKIALSKVEMEGDQINKYIAKFEGLLCKADILRTEITVMTMFTDGLQKGIHAAILCLDTWPTTLNGWEEAARREVRRAGIIKIQLGERGNAHLSTRQSKWQFKAQQTLKPKKKDDAVPMEIDAGVPDKTTINKQKENLCIQREGRCFKCGKQGHIKRECPEWKGKNEKPPPYKPKACVAKAVEPEEALEQTLDLTSLARSMKVLDSQKKEDLFDLLMEEPDF